VRSYVADQKRYCARLVAGVDACWDYEMQQPALLREGVRLYAHNEFEVRPARFARSVYEGFDYEARLPAALREDVRQYAHQEFAARPARAAAYFRVWFDQEAANLPPLREAVRTWLNDQVRVRPAALVRQLKDFEKHEEECIRRTDAFLHCETSAPLGRRY
jgi:hypothetical protein